MTTGEDQESGPKIASVPDMRLTDKDIVYLRKDKAETKKENDPHGGGLLDWTLKTPDGKVYRASLARDGDKTKGGCGKVLFMVSDGQSYALSRCRCREDGE